MPKTYAQKNVGQSWSTIQYNNINLLTLPKGYSEVNLQMLKNL